MKKVALVFISAVFIPSLILALLAIRSLRDQQLVMEGQQTLLYREVINSLFKDVDLALAEKQREFVLLTHELIAQQNPREAAADYDEALRREWPLARVGFVVSMDGEVLTPSPFAGPEARRFRMENDSLICSKETVEVYWNSPKGAVNLSQMERKEREYSDKAVFAKKSGPVSPGEPGTEEAQFRKLVGDAREGTLARYTEDRLNLLFWTRLDRAPEYVFGSQLDVMLLGAELGRLLKVEDRLREQIAVALLDDRSGVVASTAPGLNWQSPYLTVEVGESLPHWKLALAVLNPGRLDASVRTIRFTLGLLIAALLLAIGTGSWLIVRDIQKQLALARQKTDFVSNVSHELKTPLTSIRMFSEILQGPHVSGQKQREFLQIINNEASRLTRLINNVLDFARMERGEHRPQFQRIDLVEYITGLLDEYRPQLEARGYRLTAEYPEGGCIVSADRDALSQAVMNLLSNAEKYGGEEKDILVQLECSTHGACIRVCDHGPGVPRGLEERIFEQFFRANDNLNTGIPGSGLGLTLARQIARAHGGDVVYRPRSGGGSCFELSLRTS